MTREDTARGYEAAKGQYLIVEDQEIDAVQISRRQPPFSSMNSTPARFSTASMTAVVGEQNPERCIGDYARQRGAFAVVEIIV